MGIFKAYDIRGIVPDELNEESACRIGWAFATYLKARKICIGMDMRPSSPGMADAVARGASLAGSDVVMLGMVETPVINFVTASRGLDGGIMVTASHNPAGYNGFKMCRANAVPLSGDEGIPAVEELFNSVNPNDESSLVSLTGKTGKVENIDIWPAYITHAKKSLDLKRPLKVVVDAGNGMAGVSFPKFIDGTPVEVIPMYFEPDGTFPNHEANPLKEENTEDLRKRVIQEKADVGLAFDGDADRVCFVDENGHTISCDMVTALLAMEFLSRKRGEAVLYDLRSSKAVAETIKELGGRPIRCRVGHAFIKQDLRREDGVFAGELSGHYYFRDNFYTDSGLIAAGAVLSLLSREKRPLSSMIAPLRRYHSSGEINSRVSDPDKTIALLEEKYGSGAKVDHLDGLTVDMGNWWFNVRKSNTEPVLRLNLEADSDEMMVEKRDVVLDLIRS